MMVDDRRFFDELIAGSYREVDLSGLSRDGLLLVGAYALESHLPHVALLAERQVMEVLRGVMDGVWAGLKGEGRPDASGLLRLKENSLRALHSNRDRRYLPAFNVLAGRVLVAAFDGPDTEALVKKVVGHWHFYLQMVDGLYRLPPGLAERDVQPYEGLRLGRIGAVVDLVRKEPFGPGLVDRVREQAVADGALVAPHALAIVTREDGWSKKRPAPGECPVVPPAWVLDRRRRLGDLRDIMPRRADLSGLGGDGLRLVAAYAVETHLPHVALLARQQVLDVLQAVTSEVWAALRDGGRQPDPAPLVRLPESSERVRKSYRDRDRVPALAVLSVQALVASLDDSDTQWLVTHIVGSWLGRVRRVDTMYVLPPGVDPDVLPYEALRLDRLGVVVDLVRTTPFGPGLVDRVREQAVADGVLVEPHAPAILRGGDLWSQERPAQEGTPAPAESLVVPPVLVARQDPPPPVVPQTRADDVVWLDVDGDDAVRFRFGDLGRVPEHVVGWDDPPDLPVRGAVVEFVPGHGDVLGPLIAVADDGSVVWVDAEDDTDGPVQRMADSWDTFEKGFAIADRCGQQLASLELDEVDDAFAQAQEEIAQVSPGLVLPLCGCLYLILESM